MATLEELRLITKVASLYYKRNLRQSDIAKQLDLSQATVSRLLKRALSENIVRISVNAPLGSFTELEQAVGESYNLKEVIIADAGSEMDERLRNVGAAAAFYLENTIKNGEIIGISSWSETLLATANAMHSLNRNINAHVVQILGGIGDPSAEKHAVQLTRRLASIVNGEATLLSAPGIVGSRETRDILLADPFVTEAVALFDKITLALVGIGTVEPSRLLASSGNVFSEKELDLLREAGALGDICLRFFDANGQPVESDLNNRVISMNLEQFKNVKRTVAVASGKRKFEAIRAAIRGGWIHVLVTDHITAEHLIQDAIDSAA